MIASESRACFATELLPFSGSADVLPPFWELEDLIGRGFGPEHALAIIAAKRTRQDPATPSDRIHASARQQHARDEPLQVILAGC